MNGVFSIITIIILFGKNSGGMASGFRRFHSNNTDLFNICSDAAGAIDASCGDIVVLIDYSNAFDMFGPRTACSQVKILWCI